MSSRSLPSCGRARYALSFSTAALLAKETHMSYFKNLAKAIFAIDNLPPRRGQAKYIDIAGRPVLCRHSDDRWLRHLGDTSHLPLPERFLYHPRT